MLRDAFVEVRVMDRRKNPSHGYRAVHVIVDIAAKLWRFRYVVFFSTFGPSFRNGSQTW
jgi:ppGpp synthetase/RelA/SpoT-type nucleotidyltranferase